MRKAELVCKCREGDPICLAEFMAVKRLKQDENAWRKVQAKCRWEGMGVYAVLREWPSLRGMP